MGLKIENEVIKSMKPFFIDDSKIPKPYFEFDRQFKIIAGDEIVANIPYGSMINFNPSVESWLDVFVVTRDRKKFHSSCKCVYDKEFSTIGKLSRYHSALEKICAPNYYHYVIGENTHFKYCTIEIGELEKAVSDRDFSLTGRFMKVMRIMQGVKEEDKDRLLRVYFDSMSEGIDLALDVVTAKKKEFTIHQLIFTMLGLSYFTDRRVDKDLMDKVNYLYNNENCNSDENSYDSIVPVFLEMEKFRHVKQVGPNLYSDVRSTRRPVAQVRDDLKGYFNAILRMYKGGLTNSGGKDYLIGKAKKSGNYKPWMEYVPKSAMSLLIPIGLAWHGYQEIRGAVGIGPLQKREEELGSFLEIVQDSQKFEEVRAELNIN